MPQLGVQWPGAIEARFSLAGADGLQLLSILTQMEERLHDTVGKLDVDVDVNQVSSKGGGDRPTKYLGHDTGRKRWPTPT